MGSACDHLPPYTHVLHGVNPAHVLNGAGLVEVEDEAGSQHVRGLLTHLHRAPGALAGGLQTAFHALRIRGEEGGESEGLVVQLQVGGGIIQDLRLMDVDVQAVARLHLEGRLDRHGRCNRLGGIVRALLGIVLSYL